MSQFTQNMLTWPLDMDTTGVEREFIDALINEPTRQP